MAILVMMAYSAKMEAVANDRQIVKNILNKMAKGPFGKRRFDENGVISEIAKMPNNR